MELIKRVADAITSAMDALLFSDEKVPGRTAAEQMLILARAAVAAQDEPTEAMCEAARDWSAAKYGKPIGNDDAIGCWKAMNGAALK